MQIHVLAGTQIADMRVSRNISSDQTGGGDMTVAVCFKCGAIKFGAFNPCSNCMGFPQTEDDLALSMAMTDHHFDEADLRKMGETIRRGIRPTLDPAQKEQMLQMLGASGILERLGQMGEVLDDAIGEGGPGESDRSGGKSGLGQDETSDQQGSPERPGDRVLFRDAGGRELILDDLKGVSGKVNYELIGTQDIPDRAHQLHQMARQAGGKGDYPRTLELLRQAHDLASLWPFPLYDKAFTYLLMQDYSNAELHYRKVLELAPGGFFTAITALDTLARERAGEFPEGTYLAYMQLEWISDPVQKAERIELFMSKIPEFAPIWEAFAQLCEDDVQKLEAIERGLAARPDAETRGMLVLNKALTLYHGGRQEEGLNMLGELALDPESTLSTEQLAKVTLANLLK